MAGEHRTTLDSVAQTLTEMDEHIGSFDFVAAGTNTKILDSDLLTALGVTGSIVQEGLATDTPVLDDQGTIKGIRNIKDGFGITASIYLSSIEPAYSTLNCR